MGRLDDIIARNKNPRKHRQMRFPLGLMLSAFVLLILILMIFTDAVIKPDDKKKLAAPAAGSATQPEKHVDGIYLYRAPKTHDAGIATPAH